MIVWVIKKLKQQLEKKTKQRCNPDFHQKMKS